MGLDLKSIAGQLEAASAMADVPGQEPQGVSTLLDLSRQMLVELGCIDLELNDAGIDATGADGVRELRGHDLTAHLRAESAEHQRTYVYAEVERLRALPTCTSLCKDIEADRNLLLSHIREAEDNIRTESERVAQPLHEQIEKLQRELSIARDTIGSATRESNLSQLQAQVDELWQLIARLSIDQTRAGCVQADRELVAAWLRQHKTMR